MSDVSQEYHETAAWLARRRLKGVEGDPLPDTISETAENLIDDDVDTFGDHVLAATALLGLEEYGAKKFDRLLSIECAAVAEAQPRIAETNGDEVAGSMWALPNLFSPVELSELASLSEPDDGLVPSWEPAAMAA